MSKKIDISLLIGQKFGKWTIISATRKYSEKHKRTFLYCICKCECELEYEISYSSLKSGQSLGCRSCGCVKIKDYDLEQFIGKKFGKLTVEKVVREKNKNEDSRNKTIIYCVCKCECGNTGIFPLNYLKSKSVTSCGCLRTPNITGKKVNLLTVIRQYKIETGRSFESFVDCICECGNIKEKIKLTSVIRGKIKSCGCLLGGPKDLIGKRFGRLLVTERLPKYVNNKTYYKCICDCGNEVAIWHGALTSGNTRSCGCYKEEIIHKINAVDHIRKRFDRLVAMERIPHYKNNKTYYKCICDCGNETIVSSNSLMSERTHSCGCKNKEKKQNRSGENHPTWKGGKLVSWYDTYAHQIDFCEEIRRDPENLDYLQVKCSLCGKFYTPSLLSVRSRISSINGVQGGDQRFYCSDECKQQCPIYGRHKYPKGYKPESNRPYVDSYWTEEVLKQANYKCEICGSEDNLTAHHIESATLNPILANDIDNGICLCKICHYQKAHSDAGCKTSDLRCRKDKN